MVYFEHNLMNYEIMVHGVKFWPLNFRPCELKLTVGKLTCKGINSLASIVSYKLF